MKRFLKNILNSDNPKIYNYYIAKIQGDFEANKAILKTPDLIHPKQELNSEAVSCENLRLSFICHMFID